MISYTSFAYYVFILLIVTLSGVFKNFFSKSKMIFVVNIIFQILFFYFNKRNFLNLSAFLLVNFILVYLVDKLKNKKQVINIFVIFNILFFIIVKYHFANTLGIFEESQKLAFVGISFVVFKFISFYLDLRNGMIKKINYLYLYNYITFFPAYLSGPLYKYQAFAEDLENENHISDQELFDNVFRFVFGAFKKVVLADLLFAFCLDNFSLESALTFSIYQKIFALYLYAIVLYLDFSGYSDMAISVAKMLGITITENFNRPYLALNIQDFWNRWHISFMNWLRDYIYYPFQMFLLKTVKVKDMNLATILSTMLIFLITGVWHGDQLNYFYYGLFHALSFAVFLIWKNILLKKLSKETRVKYFESKVFNCFSWFLTMNYFVFSLSFFINKYQVFFNVYFR